MVGIGKRLGKLNSNHLCSASCLIAIQRICTLPIGAQLINSLSKATRGGSPSISSIRARGTLRSDVVEAIYYFQEKLSGQQVPWPFAR
jgi:hypothetical protein